MADNLTVAELVELARSQGFSAKECATAGAIAKAESGGDKNATHKNVNGSTDYGLWQINSVHKDLLAKYDWHQPYANALMAHEIYKGAGNKFTPWVTYKTGAHLPFMPAANKAAKTAKPAGTGSSTTVGGVTVPDEAINPVLGPLKALGQLVNTILSGEFWRRLGIGALGLLVLTLGVVFFMAEEKAKIIGAVAGAKGAVSK